MHLYNEINPYCAAVLRARIADGRLPEGKVDERDITTIPDADFCGFDQVHLFAGIGGFTLGVELAGGRDWQSVITGGFPCQDISNAGKRAGISGERSGLWREMLRCVRVVRPNLVFVENVAALLGRGMDTVLGDLAEIGYDARWDCVSAADVGAPHLRQRIWILAYPIGGGHFRHDGYASEERRKIRNDALRNAGTGGPLQVDVVADSTSARRDRRQRGKQPIRRRPLLCASSLRGADADGNDGLGRFRSLQVGRLWCPGEAENDGGFKNPQWGIEPDVGRVAHGIPARVDRLTALGNAIVPQACTEAIRRLMANSYNADEGPKATTEGQAV